MKKMVALMTAVLICVLCGSLTFAESGAQEEGAQMQYENTKLCAQMLESYEIEYAVMETDDNGYERLSVNLTDEESKLPYEMRFYFHPSGDSVSIRVWDLIEYNEETKAEVLAACNEANKEWKYITFVAEEDNTVTVELDQLCSAENVGDICWKAMIHIGNAVGHAYSGQLGELAVCEVQADEAADGEVQTAEEQ